MTTPAVDLRAVEQDIAAVLAAHGLGGHDTVQVAAYEVEQGGQTAGITVNVLAYTRPTAPPTERMEQPDSFGVLADHLLQGVTTP